MISCRIFSLSPRFLDSEKLFGSIWSMARIRWILHAFTKRLFPRSHSEGTESDRGTVLLDECIWDIFESDTRHSGYIRYISRKMESQKVPYFFTMTAEYYFHELIQYTLRFFPSSSMLLIYTPPSRSIVFHDATHSSRAEIRIS